MSNQSVPSATPPAGAPPRTAAQPPRFVRPGTPVSAVPVAPHPQQQAPHPQAKPSWQTAPATPQTQYTQQQVAQYAAQQQQAQYTAQQAAQAQYAAQQQAQYAAQQAAQAQYAAQQQQATYYAQQQAQYAARQAQAAYPQQQAQQGYALPQSGYQQQQAQGYYGYAQQAAPAPLSPARQILLAQKKRRKVILIVMGIVIALVCISAVIFIIKRRDVSFESNDVIARNAVAKHINRPDGKYEVRCLVGPSSGTIFVVTDKSSGGKMATYYRVEMAKLFFAGWSVSNVSTITSVYDESGLATWASLNGLTIEPLKK